MANVNIGDPAIPFDLPGVDGQNHRLADYADKAAVAVIFSCNHCPYVLAWEDRMIQIQADYADRGVQLSLYYYQKKAYNEIDNACVGAS